MKNLPTLQEAFALENLDANAITISGVPERHIEALKAVAQLFVMHDAVNADFQPDFNNYDQDKYANWFEIGSPSGVGFAFVGADSWRTFSSVGARLVSENSAKAKHIAKECESQYKALMVYQIELKK